MVMVMMVVVVMMVILLMQEAWILIADAYIVSCWLEESEAIS
jgi:hypothetical protein